MARTLEIYPQATLEGATWTYTLEVSSASGVTEFTHTAAAGIVALTPLRVLKVVFSLTVGDTVTDADIDAALFVDTISRGPNRNQTLWASWQARAETNIAALVPPYTETDFLAAWTTGHTSRIRSDARDILEQQRGWTVTAAHQHEGDRVTVTEE